MNDKHRMLKQKHALTSLKVCSEYRPGYKYKCYIKSIICKMYVHTVDY